MKPREGQKRAIFPSLIVGGGGGGVGFPFILPKIVAYGFITSVSLPPPPASPPNSEVMELQKRKISMNVDIAIEPDMDFS